MGRILLYQAFFWAGVGAAESRHHAHHITITYRQYTVETKSRIRRTIRDGVYTIRHISFMALQPSYHSTHATTAHGRFFLCIVRRSFERRIREKEFCYWLGGDDWVRNGDRCRRESNILGVNHTWFLLGHYQMFLLGCWAATLLGSQELRVVKAGFYYRETDIFISSSLTFLGTWIVRGRMLLLVFF